MAISARTIAKSHGMDAIIIPVMSLSVAIRPPSMIIHYGMTEEELDVVVDEELLEEVDVDDDELEQMCWYWLLFIYNALAWENIEQINLEGTE